MQPVFPGFGVSTTLEKLDQQKWPGSWTQKNLRFRENSRSFHLRRHWILRSGISLMVSFPWPPWQQYIVPLRDRTQLSGDRLGRLGFFRGWHFLPSLYLGIIIRQCKETYKTIQYNEMSQGFWSLISFFFGGYSWHGLIPLMIGSFLWPSDVSWLNRTSFWWSFLALKAGKSPILDLIVLHLTLNKQN